MEDAAAGAERTAVEIRMDIYGQQKSENLELVNNRIVEKLNLFLQVK